MSKEQFTDNQDLALRESWQTIQALGRITHKYSSVYGAQSDVDKFFARNNTDHLIVEIPGKDTTSLVTMYHSLAPVRFEPLGKSMNGFRGPEYRPYMRLLASHVGSMRIQTGKAPDIDSAVHYNFFSDAEHRGVIIRHNDRIGPEATKIERLRELGRELLAAATGKPNPSIQSGEIRIVTAEEAAILTATIHQAGNFSRPQA